MEFCSIASGSSGNCTFASAGKTSILVDAGIPGKSIQQGLAMVDRKLEDIDAILVTHEHSDHIRSLGVLARKCHTPIYATEDTLHAIFGMSSMGKLDYSLFHAIRPDEPFLIGEIEVKPFSISHDAADPVGYRLESGGRRFAVATDMGCYDDYIVKNLSGFPFKYSPSKINLPSKYSFPFPFLFPFKYSPSKINFPS